MTSKNKKTLGFALSGSGNRSTFYIGFLERLQSLGIKPDYISACSGASIVVSAYATGNLLKLKERLVTMKKKELTNILTCKRGKGGLFSLDKMQEELSKYTDNKTFENIQIKMNFTAVDLENGELVILEKGDLAKSARISSTVPGIFEPVIENGRTLVDGGLLCHIPFNSLKLLNPDIVIGVDMRNTPNIFTSTHISIKKLINFFKKILLLDFFSSLVLNQEKRKFVNKGLFSILGRSLDLIIESKKHNLSEGKHCDLLISPNFPRLKTTDISENAFRYYYDMGVRTAEENYIKIKNLSER